MQKCLWNVTEWLVRGFNVFDAYFIAKATETVKKANKRSVQ